MLPKDVLFRFGLLSDIQYADMESASNFSGSELRHYRDSAAHAAETIRGWRSLDAPPRFIAQLGDLIDGQNAGEYGQGLKLEAPQSEAALRVALEAWRDCEIPTYHAIGNHELYNFTWSRLSEALNSEHLGASHRVSDPERQRFYFSWQPAAHWRAIMLCCYEENVIRPRTPQQGARADSILRTHNPNYGQAGAYNFFEGLTPPKQRYVPFNAGLGAEQLSWLQGELSEARRAGDRVLVMGHLPLYAPAASPRNVAFDADEALEILQAAGCVSAYFAGHRHGGGYARDASGIHHVTVQAPLTHGLCAALVDVSADCISVHGEGAHQSYQLSLS